MHVGFVSDVNDTGRPEDEVAEIVNPESRMVLSGIGANVIACGVPPTSPDALDHVAKGAKSTVVTSVTAHNTVRRLRSFPVSTPATVHALVTATAASQKC